MPSTLEHLVLLLVLLARPAIAQQQSCPVSSAVLQHSLVKLRPNADCSVNTLAQLFMAKNEYESFQVILTGPLSNVSAVVSASALAAFGGSAIVYRQLWMNISNVSNCEGAVGLWPDPLVPAVDPYFNETRNAFPLDVPAGQQAMLFVDLFAPPSAAAGTYAVWLEIAHDGDQVLRPALNVTVWDFALPSTASLPTIYGSEPYWVVKGHYPTEWKSLESEMLPLGLLYLDAGLMHRVTLSQFLTSDPRVLDNATIDWDWAEFDAQFAPWVETGRRLPFGLADARVTTMQLPSSHWYGVCTANMTAYWAGWSAHLHEKGPAWFDLVYDYTIDEPWTQQVWDEFFTRAACVRSVDPALRILATTEADQAALYNATSWVDLWVPIINYVNDKVTPVCNSDYSGNHRPDYDFVTQDGKWLYWYESCMSHGCGGGCYPGDNCTTGWTSKMIDHNAVGNRIMPWMSYLYDMGGELYWNTQYMYYIGDAWESQFIAGGNGDGTLFYPGRPELIGGAHHIPIDSLRLKLIRDAMEDYEYLLLFERCFSRAKALSFVTQLVQNTYTYDSDPATLLGLRQQIGEAVAACSSAAASS